MPFLLDTNVLLRLIDGRLDTLPPPLRKIVTDPDHAFFASVASLWEIAIKSRLGKLTLGHSLSLLPDIVGAMGVALIAIDHRHVLAEASPEPATRDPFDRLLLAQCDVENMKLITLDRALADHPLAWRAT